jgi:diguanylate cyclase (GGDEF)-like protein
MSDPEQAVSVANEELQSRLRQLEWRDTSLRATTFAVLLLMCVAIVSVSSSIVLAHEQIWFRQRLDIAVRGLVGLVLLFSLFSLYQQNIIHRLREELAGELVKRAIAENRAKVMEELAIRDPLTGLFNRRYLMEQLPTEIARAERYGQPLTVLVLDLNNFKAINDTHGHPAGDAALCAFSRHLRRAIRSSDIAVRTGGDEFLVIFPECSIVQIAAPVARMTGCSFDHGGTEIPINFSYGYADLRQDDSVESLLARADAAFYSLKQNASRQMSVRE